MGEIEIDGDKANMYRTKIASIAELETGTAGLRVFGLQPDYDISLQQGISLVGLVFGDNLGTAKETKTRVEQIEKVKIKQVMVLHENGGVVYALDATTEALKFVTVILKAPQTTDL